jgi:hypothetical protein
VASIESARRPRLACRQNRATKKFEFVTYHTTRVESIEKRRISLPSLIHRAFALMSHSLHGSLIG